jgi:hypothetical protein
MFKLFKKKEIIDEKLEIDDNLILESKKPKGRQFIDYKNYRDKSVEWLEKHLKIIDSVVNGKKLGTKQQGSFILEGKKIFKTDVTRKLFNEMFDNYVAYYYALKRYIVIRKELDVLDKVKQEDYLVAGRAKEFNNEATKIEKKLNIYLDNIIKSKYKIKDEVFVS